MSRYTLPAKKPQHEVVVGYDTMLGCFFVQLWALENLGSPPLIDRNLQTLDERGYKDLVDLPQQLHQQLLDEAAGRVPSTACRRWMEQT